ncbi:hemolysin III family protein [Chryseobacterium sp. SNU WT5]|uniref:PAQR family membrane homeostasis protein TrhA n=1 Tax=Chryseobacterium sp. SNU WT5 TaxID=2594269 RepID=UPI00117C643F|nr:hemolysin III family protein [Chryseobacterium sp. SNU WT5]QDP84305.1 hemolysin III family protein [Chryseobacterium sp. SNU WT5]
MKTEKTYLVHTYSDLEEKLNVWSHFVGLVMSVVALIFLIFKAVALENVWAMISFPIFGVSMIVLYLASTLYHFSKTPKIRYRLNIFDHAAIYVLIAGSYTPFVLVSLNGTEGYVIFSIVWGIAFLGIIFKIFFTGRFNILSTLLYVVMGWLIIFSFKSLMISLNYDGLIWLISGGVAYTVGAILYSINKLKFNHAIFHIFVLAGTFCHFVSVYFYVIPVSSIS